MPLLSFETWGTNFSLRTDKVIEEDIVAEIKKTLKEYEEIFSLHLPHSEVVMTNNRAMIKNSNLFLQIERLSANISEITKGKFSHLRNDKLDFNSIAKGHVVDYISEYIAPDYDYFVLNFGGDIAVRGDRDYFIAIESPKLDGSSITEVVLKNAGIATSGNYYRPGHINSLYESVSVYGPSTTICDALSTAVAGTPVEEINYLPEGYKAVIYPTLSLDHFYLI